mgnify:FL=1|jgi:hypothetical protein
MNLYQPTGNPAPLGIKFTFYAKNAVKYPKKAMQIA